MKTGDHVEVRNSFDNQWSRGFEVTEVLDDDTLRIRRRSDGAMLPVVFGRDDVREEKRRAMWWV